ncbi:MAG: tRNA preQ1(34) S-adenosylmethionine ribosyltransferase-isomerase QueA [Chloroflexi bacterium]|nr:tRNA preQ1(34) S-adenosylmethionine ribosyltransferase-isomerase QueA [Chloroflexota bacterium]
MDLRTEDFDYDLPPALIAQEPVEPRDASRLLVIHRTTDTTEQIEHRWFRDIVEYLRPGDLLIANDSRVLPGRLSARKPTGGRVELLLLRPLENGWWEALARPAQRLRPGQHLTLQSPKSKVQSPKSKVVAPITLDFGPGAWDLEFGERTPSGGIQVRFEAPVEEVMAAYGEVPLPPYIHTPLADPERYQTVYSRVTGSAAAPTAGLHFTPQLLETLAAIGVQFAFVTLHVGPDTFRPVRVERIVEHKMHAEFVSVPDETARAIVAAKHEGRRVVAVGTTAVRALESWARVVEIRGRGPGGPGTEESERQETESQMLSGTVEPRVHPGLPSSDPIKVMSAPEAGSPRPLGWSGWTRLFIVPGYQFQVVDALITNFHLPRSTLLMLVSAFAGRDLIRRAYEAAIAKRYRFYSFGDASLIV